jgi:Transposase
MSICTEAVLVVGVDTHSDTHTAAICDGRGRKLAELRVTAEPDGYAAVLAWARRAAGDTPLRWAIEGTRHYGLGLARHLTSAGEQVEEIDAGRPVWAALIVATGPIGSVVYLPAQRLRKRSPEPMTMLPRPLLGSKAWYGPAPAGGGDQGGGRVQIMQLPEQGGQLGERSAGFTFREPCRPERHDPAGGDDRLISRPGQPGGGKRSRLQPPGRRHLGPEDGQVVGGPRDPGVDPESS